MKTFIGERIVTNHGHNELKTLIGKSPRAQGLNNKLFDFDGFDK